MKNHTINQGQSFLVALIPITSYSLLYSYYVSANIYTTGLSLGYTLMLLLYYFRITNGPEELMYLNRRTGEFWEGFYMSPSAAPFLERLNVYIPWGVKKTVELPQEVFKGAVKIEHYHDDRRKRFQVNTTVGPITLAIMHGLSNFFGWWFAIKEPKDIGFRGIIIFLCAGWAANHKYPVERTWELKNPFAFFQAHKQARTTPPVVTRSENTSSQNSNPSRTQENTSVVVTHITEGMPPTMPNETWFKVQGANDPLPKSIMISGDPREYILYRMPIQGNIPTVYVDTSLCALVPFGARIKFDTTYPALRTANMHALVRYIRKESTLTFWEHREIDFHNRFFGRTKSQILETSATWQYVRNNWSEVNTKDYNIIAIAMTKEQVDETLTQNPHPHGNGALVCF